MNFHVKMQGRELLNYLMGHFQSDDHVPLDKYNGNGVSCHIPGFVERLLREREPSSNHEAPFSQRLLVVANRLPVSAIRTGEDSWSMEMSAGGLVSALLG